MMERRVLVGMAGVVAAVLFAFLAQAVMDTRDCGPRLCASALEMASRGGHG